MHGLSFLLYRQMSPQCTFNTGGLWQRQQRLLVLFCLVLQDLLHSQPSDWLSLTEKHSILRFLIKKFLNRAQVYFMLPTQQSIPVMAGNYCVSAPRGRKSRMRNSWDCPFKEQVIEHCHSNTLRRRLLREKSTVSLSSLIDIARSMESANFQAANIENASSQENSEFAHQLTTPTLSDEEQANFTSDKRQQCTQCGNQPDLGLSTSCSNFLKRWLQCSQKVAQKLLQNSKSCSKVAPKFKTWSKVAFNILV